MIDEEIKEYGDLKTWLRMKVLCELVTDVAWQMNEDKGKLKHRSTSKFYDKAIEQIDEYIKRVIEEAMPMIPKISKTKVEVYNTYVNQKRLGMIDYQNKLSENLNNLLK